MSAQERCECGTLLSRHPPLPKPKPWDVGRPCGRPADFRRYADGTNRDPDEVRKAEERRKAVQSGRVPLHIKPGGHR